MIDIFGSKRLGQAMRRSLSHTRLYPSSHFAFIQGWKAACRFLKRVHDAERQNAMVKLNEDKKL